MSRYDEFSRPPRGRRYDQRAYGHRPYDRGMRGGPPPGQPARTESYSEAAGMYGPARYGLGPYYRRVLERRRPDDELREEIEESLFYDTWVDAEAIEVEVRDGVATLRGELPSYDEVRYAIVDAWDVDGVRGVRSELNVRDSDG